jgi:hypothetical protein
MSDLFFDKESEQDYSFNEEMDPSGRVDGSERSSNHNSRTVHKNKYINKIRDLGAEERNSAAKEDCSAKSLDKKARNKYSAKQSRDRKKLYI